jgi:DME family drug/metabolite transporter
MLVEGLALVTALSNAGSSVLVSKGMKNSNPYSASFLSTLMQAATLTLILLTDLPEPDWTAVAFFALSGILALGLGRLLYFVSMREIGVAASSAVIGSNPLVTTVLAILFLGEAVAPSTFLGALMVGVGIFLMSGASGVLGKGSGLIIACLSALAYAFSNIVRKMGINVQPNSLLGAQVGAMSGVLSFFMYLTFKGVLSQIKVNRHGMGCYVAAGIIASLGWIALMKALELGSVSVVTTIAYSYPLFSLLLSWLFLREQELGWRVASGCLVIVLGVVVVTLL